MINIKIYPQIKMLTLNSKVISKIVYYEDQLYLSIETESDHVIIRYTNVGNVYEEGYPPCISKTSFVYFEKGLADCSRYNILNFRPYQTLYTFLVAIKSHSLLTHYSHISI